MSADDVVGASLARCEELSATTNALVAIRPQAESEAGGRGPLAGVPLLLKDMFAADGRTPTVGSAVTAPWVEGTATVVSRLRGAGAVIVAYTNLHEWAIGTTSAVTASGPIENPRHPGAIAGGSSGGSAAGLVLGAAPLAVGTDAGGSIRIPSACCGVVGLKPTWGAVPLDGLVLPDGPPIDHIGPMARTVDDVRLLFEVMAAQEVGRVDISRARLGIPKSSFFADLTHDVARRYEETLAVLEPLVGRVEDVELDCTGATEAVAGTLLPYVASVLDSELEERPGDFQPQTLNALMLGASFTEEDRADAEMIRRSIRASFDAVLAEVDVVVTPTLPGPPPSIEDQTVALASGSESTELAYTRFNVPMNFAGAPALSLPIADGLSLTLTAARGRDDVVLALGAALEAALDGAFANRVI